MNHRVFHLFVTGLVVLSGALALLGWLVLKGHAVGGHEGHYKLALLALTLMASAGAMLFVTGLQLKRRGEKPNHNHQMFDLFDSISDAIVIHDTQGRMLEVNQGACKQLGYERAELMQLPLSSIDAPECATRIQERMQALQTHGRVIFEAAHVRKDGQPFPVEVHARVIEYDGQPAVISVVRDITERKQLQAVDRLFHEIDQQVLRGLPLQTLLEFICGEVARLFGYPFVWVGRKEAGGEISIAACSGAEPAYLDELQKIAIRWDDTPQGHCPAGQTIRLGQTQVYKCADPGFGLWRAGAEGFHLKSIMGIPLVIRGDVYGAFTLYSQHERGFDDPATALRLSNIASHICIALEMVMDQQQLRLLSTALSSAGNGVFITDRRGHIQWLNESFTRLTGYAEEDALGGTPRILNSGKQDAAYYQDLWQTITQGQVWSSETIEKRKDGSEFTVQQTITPIREVGGDISHFISILEDITTQKAAEARIQHLAHYDALTELPNRALFYDRLQQLLVQAKRSVRPLALIFLDLDRFKEVNDSLGHHIGDLLLKGVAERLTHCVRETDTVARLAGDEFTILLPQIAGQEDAATVAQKIIAAFATPFMLGGHEVLSSASIGIALYPQDAADEENLLKCADSAMYIAKQKGRNNYCFFEAASSESL